MRRRRRARARRRGRTSAPGSSAERPRGRARARSARGTAARCRRTDSRGARAAAAPDAALARRARPIERDDESGHGRVAIGHRAESRAHGAADRRVCAVAVPGARSRRTSAGGQGARLARCAGPSIRTRSDANADRRSTGAPTARTSAGAGASSPGRAWRGTRRAARRPAARSARRGGASRRSRRAGAGRGAPRGPRRARCPARSARLLACERAPQRRRAYSRSTPWRGWRTRSAHVAVVGQQEQALAILVEAARPGRAARRSGDERRRDEIEHGALGVPVARRSRSRRPACGGAGRRSRRGRSDEPAVDRDDGAVRVGLLAELRRRGRRRSRGPPAMSVLACPARRDAGRGEHLLEALGGHQAGPSASVGVRRRSPAASAAIGMPSPPSSASRAATSTSSGGSSSRLVRPKRSRKSKPVPYRNGRPGASDRPSSTTAGGAAASGPCSRSRRRGCARSPRVTGCR